MGRHSLTGRAGAAAALTKFATEPGLMIVGCAKRTAGRVPGARHGCATGRGGDGPPPAKLVRECTGCGAVWQRACFGSKKSPVQIRPARPGNVFISNACTIIRLPVSDYLSAYRSSLFSPL